MFCPGLFTHRGPILTVANWSGTWPGLVGMLNLNGSLTKMGVPYSTIWSENFTDAYFKSGLQQWLSRRRRHPRSKPCPRFGAAQAAAGRTNTRPAGRPRVARRRKRSWASSTKAAWECTTPSFRTNCSTRPGVFKERLSQSSLYAAMLAGAGCRSA